MAQSGAVLREVGTTNRTRVADYAAAIGERTALVLRVHPSNFRIEGFAERPRIEALVDLGHRFHVPVVEDLGSGWLSPGDGPAPAGLDDEPSVSASVRAGADLVTFSGDKLLGGPQAGLVVGRRDLVDRVRHHPLIRALRADKLTYAALEATLALWAQAARRQEVPAYRMLTLATAEIDRRAPGITCRMLDGMSAIGGGSAPGSALPTRLVAVEVAGLSAAAFEARLRAGDPPVVARIQNDIVVLDLRTVGDEEDAELAGAIVACGSP
jgi:L-seryl-tRNA(Ser) seleniumtransferase